jgi:3-oxoacyl-[acyl-carrier protein] reductase
MKFEDILIGTFAELSRVISKEDVEKFAALSGDNNKLHVDPTYAATTPYKRPVVHGMLGASFISTVIGTKLPGDGALWFSQVLEFMRPVRVGDSIIVRVEVLEKRDRDRVLVLQTDIFNQHKQKVTTGTAKVRVAPDAAPRAITSGVPLDRVALVVGGSGGIGSAICRSLARDDCSVAVHYRSNVSAAERIATSISDSGGRAVTIQGDLNDPRAPEHIIAETIRRLDAIDVLVHCVSASTPAVPLRDLDWADMQKHLDMQVRSAFSLAQEAAPFLAMRGGGSMVLITTQYIDGAPPSQLLPYVTAKAALHGFGKALAIELAPQHIRVNMVSPGMCDTALIGDVPERARLTTVARTPLKQLMDPNDIAEAVRYLSSDRSRMITGETIRVNGGQFMG